MTWLGSTARALPNNLMSGRSQIGEKQKHVAMMGRWMICGAALHGLWLSLTAGAATVWFTNSAPIAIPGSGAGAPYPSVIELNGLPGNISQVEVALDGLQHSYPDDLDILLANSRTNVLLMSDRGGSYGVTNVSLLFSDMAIGFVPDSSVISAGNYKPSNDGTLDYLPSPAPMPPHGSKLGLFAGGDPNGKWSLYIADDASGDAGALLRGWRLGLTITNVSSPDGPQNADLSVTLTDSPHPALTEQSLILQTTVFNSGPALATAVAITNILPAGVEFVSASSSQGTCGHSDGVVFSNVDSLACGAAVIVTVRVLPLVTGAVTTSATVCSAQADGISANNAATISAQVALGPPSLRITDAVVTERSAFSTNATFVVSLSRAADQTVNVNYATADGTASAGSDYYAANGTLSFPPGTTNLLLSVEVLGDQLVESDEYFFLNLSDPVNATVARPQARATILNDDALPAHVDHFAWSTIDPVQYQHAPVPITITALDAAGNIATNFNGSISLTGVTGVGTVPPLLLTEVDLANDGVELANPTAFPLDLTGWRVYFYDWTTWPMPCQVFEAPPGTVAPPVGVMAIRDTGTPPGSYPAFVLGGTLSWANEAVSNQVAVLLVDPSGNPADFFCAIEATPAQITSPVPVSIAQWTGNPATANLVSSLTYQRVGSVDHNDASDWQLLANSMGSTNTGLVLPLAGPRPIAIYPGSSGSFVAGVWSGMVLAAESVTNMYFKARDDDGHVGNSGWFRVLANSRPVPAFPILGRYAPVAAKLPATALLGSDDDGDTISLSWVAGASSHGVPITYDGVWVYYTPDGVHTNSDSFSYVVRDAHGATNVGTVTLSVPVDTNTTSSLSVTGIGNGTFLVRFAGIPGSAYIIEATTNLVTPSWSALKTATADIYGGIEFVDTPPSGTVRFYRLAPGDE